LRRCSIHSACAARSNRVGTAKVDGFLIHVMVFRAAAGMMAL
jgi:hypothetical protein